MISRSEKRLFVYGSLLHVLLRRVVLRQAVQGRRFLLPDYYCGLIRGEHYLGAVYRRGARLQGQLLKINNRKQWRGLAQFEGRQYARRRVSCRAAGFSGWVSLYTVANRSTPQRRLQSPKSDQALKRSQLRGLSESQRKLFYLLQHLQKYP